MCRYKMRPILPGEVLRDQLEELATRPHEAARRAG
jgi:plasmid maintenance system antidote protein VapI